MTWKLLPIFLVLASWHASAQHAMTSWNLITSEVLPSADLVYAIQDFYDFRGRRFAAFGTSRGIRFAEILPNQEVVPITTITTLYTSTQWSMIFHRGRLYARPDGPEADLLIFDVRNFPDTIITHKIKTLSPATLRIDKAQELMYVCGIAVADLQIFDLSKNCDQPHFFYPTKQLKEWLETTQELMYVCGIAAADLPDFDFSKTSDQPHFLFSSKTNYCGCHH